MTSFERALFYRCKLFLGYQLKKAAERGESRLADRTAEILVDLELALSPKVAKMMPHPMDAVCCNRAGNRELT